VPLGGFEPPFQPPEGCALSSSILKRADATIQLPMHGRKESLNVAVAFGIAGYEINKHRNFAWAK